MVNAIGELSRLHPSVRFRVAGSPFGGAAGAETVWVVGEVLGAEGTATVERPVEILVSGAGTSGTGRLTLAPGSRTFAVAVPLSAPAQGPIEIRARVSGTTIPLSDTVRVEAAAPLLYRRGPSTGNRLVPVAAPQFSRTERLRLEIPVGADPKPGTGRVLDRNSQPLAVPVTFGERTDTAAGQRWLTADITLASLAMGDYVVELRFDAGGTERTVLSAIRVGR
jgi:uncharacterized protein YfaS (alpha-2-macroglobulin family)